ncbi:acyl-CoA N-acyltransferase [Mycena olivaceomarginata]|nr:acyl-CoA N-acyltransferase [Mycena olivaceomarginata]
MTVPDILPSLSGRTVLVRPREEDDSAVAALRSNIETRRYLPFLPEHVSVEDARAQRLARAADATRIPFNIHLSNSDLDSTTFVGTFKSCEIGILIRPECVRGGLATDALHTVLAYAFEKREEKFHRVAFVTAVDNVGMRGWLDKAGATLEGIQRESRSDGMGGYMSMCVYSILEDEWENTVKPRLEERISRASALKA